MLHILLLGCLTTQITVCALDSSEKIPLFSRKKPSPLITTSYQTFCSTKKDILEAVHSAASYYDGFGMQYKQGGHLGEMVVAYCAPEKYKALQKLGTLRARAYMSSWPQAEQDAIVDLIHVLAK